ncbi:MAG: hypothetical protein ACC635_07235, partial [Acidiferrobacterales bacterium]
QCHKCGNQNRVFWYFCRGLSHVTAAGSVSCSKDCYSELLRPDYFVRWLCSPPATLVVISRSV